MNETINLMKAHTSIRRFTEEQISDEELRAIIDAGRAASSWKNFQSYSIIVVRSKEKKEALFDLVPQEAIRQSSRPSCFLLATSIVLKRALNCTRMVFTLKEPKIFSLAR